VDRTDNTSRVEPTRTVLAAGAVVWRRVSDRTELLVVHRPKYDDWSFPKGKLDRGERLPVTAVREVGEETTVPIRLGRPLPMVRYPLRKPRPSIKEVSFWIGRPAGASEITLDPNREIDAARWVQLDAVAGLLTYEHDHGLLDEFVRLRDDEKAHETWPLVVLRHAAARSRTQWKGDDRRRTLNSKGNREARRLIPLLEAYGITDVVSSDSARCVQTVVPYADHLDVDLDLYPELSEEGATPDRVAGRVRGLAASKRAMVVCTHRPVLPLVFETLGIEPVRLEPAQLLVAHRRGRDVLATELHRA
jgi:8-oxo-dGTP pyrophosphatase MutT (NUDIX family)/phosphohistidine phosphatase SixA